MFSLSFLKKYLSPLFYSPAKAFNNLSIFALQSKDPVKIVTVRTTAFEADESQGDAVSETTLDAPGIEFR